MDIADLEARYGLAGRIKFAQGPAGLVFAQIENAYGMARLCLQGAQVTMFRPMGQGEPVIWLSEHASFAAGKSIRGGMPVCWPWFGPHATDPALPAHGFARTALWQVAGSAALASGETEISLALPADERLRVQWPHDFRLELRIVVGASLKARLTTINLGQEDFFITEALHTYFRIGDIAEILVTGLDGCEYEDKVAGGSRRVQEGDVEFRGEVDRVYVNTEADCIIEDRRLARRIRVSKGGSRSTVVWSPWADKAARLGDIGPDGWRSMVCVESGNALDNVVWVAPGCSHSMHVEYSAQAL